MQTGVNIYVVGCGGIGGYLAEHLPGAITAINLHYIEKIRGKDAMVDLLERAGQVALPSLIDRVVLIDGDTFNPRNAIRQTNGAGNKMRQVVSKLQDSMMNISYNQNVSFDGINDYVTPENIQQYIPLHPAPNPWNDKMDRECFVPLVGDFDRRPYTVIFLCVDNLKTRWEISKYAEDFDNVLVINGGNKKVVGHVTIYERRNGEPLDPNLFEVYTDVTPDKDKRPDELACTTVAPDLDQLGTVNCVIACQMIDMFSKWAKVGLDSFPSGKNTCRKNEVIYDAESKVMTPLFHPKAQK